MHTIPAGDKTNMVGQYLMEKVPGLRLTPEMYTAFAFLSDKSEFVGGCVVTNFREGQFGNDCEITCAAETPMAFRPHVFRAVFGYVFEQLSCVRLTAVTTTRNKRARTFLEAIGFVLEGNIRRGYDGRRNALVYGLLASDCRYLGSRGADG